MLGRRSSMRGSWAGAAWSAARRLAGAIRRRIPKAAPPAPAPQTRRPAAPGRSAILGADADRRLLHWFGGRTEATEASLEELIRLARGMAPDQEAAVQRALADGTVRSRRLGPRDGVVWELPGLRVFAITGVQAFTVRDEGS